MAANKTGQNHSHKHSQQNTARLAVSTAFLLATGKFVVYIFTGSLAVLASAMDSLMDIVASGINYFSIRKALKPADADHQYGHGKAESLAGFVQAQLMAGSAVYIIYEAAVKLWYGASPLTREHVGMAVMAVSAFLSFLLVRRMTRVARETGSVALRAESIHYFTDVLTNFGVFVALGMVYWLELAWIDPVLSLGIAGYLGLSAWGVLRESVDILMDKSLPSQELRMIHEVLSGYYPEVVSYHNLQTRRAGNKKFLDVHLVMPNVSSLEQGHALAKRIISQIQQSIPEADVNILLDSHDDSREATNRDGGIRSDLY